MIIHKVLNNNVITVIDYNGKESVMMGTGIGFGKKSGNSISKEQVQKVFILENDTNKRFLKLLDDISPQYLELAEKIIKHAEEKLNIKLNESLYLTLTDHLSYAFERYNQNVELKNPLIWEMKRLYRKEFQIGLDSIGFVKEEFGIAFPEDEAASIAMHILSGKGDSNIPEITKMVKMMEDILKIVKYHFRIQFDEESLHYQRFLTHLNFFIQRVISHNPIEEDKSGLYEIVSEKYPEYIGCVDTISEYINGKTGYIVTKNERLYLTLHLSRILN